MLKMKNRMSRRGIGALIAGLVLGAQVGLATAGSSDFPLGAQELRVTAEPPVQTTYRAEHAGGQTATRNDSFPGGPSEEPWQLLPGQAAYFDRKAERAATSAPDRHRSNAD